MKNSGDGGGRARGSHGHAAAQQQLVEAPGAPAHAVAASQEHQRRKDVHQREAAQSRQQVKDAARVWGDERHGCRDRAPQHAARRLCLRWQAASVLRVRLARRGGGARA
eukprot:scaffold107580_cov66-Phaeocystis_antarctica.AAC.10